MRSPFPGMDPYLEGELRTSAHTALIAETWRYLSPRLRPRYVVLMEKRFTLSYPEIEDGVAIEAVGGSVRPDAAIVAGERSSQSVGPGAPSPALLELDTMMPEAVPQHTLEIRDAATRELVTAIELLSPSNKRGQGRSEYLARRDQLLLSRAHLVEIDLLRSGARVPMRQALPSYPYFVFLSRAGRRPLTQVWPIPLRQPLPRIAIPLLPGDTDIELDLQEVLEKAYETGGYDLIVDYARAAEPPLETPDAMWAQERVQAQRATG
jgi:hypothetical protein